MPTSTLGEKINVPTSSADVYENNETNINNNVLEFVLHQISLLKFMPTDFIEFKNVMKTLKPKNIWLYKSGDINYSHIKEIEHIF